ncbi:MAG: desulfoferrodoxin family protein [Sphaerochaeta sp.]|jgi:superoxide reductase|nr:desulfoferrodoxin [Spirochaetales bacterium]
MKDQEFYICKICGNIASKVIDRGPTLSCCGEEMTTLTVNTVDASKEKHVPVVTVDKDIVTVNVGSVDHPMTKEHNITWIYLQTEKGGQRKSLPVDSKPHATFCIDNDKPVAVLAYCNLHGLWKTAL